MLLTQANWLRMPVMEPASSLDPPNGAFAVGTTLLKRHKTLPHPREDRLPQRYPSTPATKPHELAIDTGVSSITSSDASSPRTLKHASKKRIGSNGLPPTPPTHSRQSSGSQHSIPAPKFDIPRIQTPTDVPSAPSTPPNQRSPPTPDFTPPRAMPLAFRPGRPPVTERYPSSRTDSFKTAREHPESEDEDEQSTVRPGLPSARTSTVDVPQGPQAQQKRREVGLGLGLESDEGTTTPRAKVDSSQEEFVVFDGEWASPVDDAEVVREWDDNLMRNVTVRKRPVRKLQKRRITTNFLTDEVIEDDIVSPTGATKVAINFLNNDEVIDDDIVSSTPATKTMLSRPLQERIARYKLAKETANRIVSEKLPEKSPWPSTVASPEPIITQDTRRLSTMSGQSLQSTVVEAMVVDAKPMRRRTLRHTKKQVGLRDLGSEYSVTGSGTSSIVSSEPQHRLHHQMAKIPERKHHSLASNGTVSTTSSSGQSRREIIKSGAIPVVVIPERRSSNKSSAAPSLRSNSSSRKTKRSMSLNSAPLSASSKFNDPGYFDSLPPRKRTMSQSLGSAHSVHTIDFPPVIPARRSSLSAPTSRNTSRAGSLTAESLSAHNMIQAKKQEITTPDSVVTRPSADVERDIGSHSQRLNVDHNGDPFFGKRLSTQVTPFSQVSYETAGTMAEVSEAMAVTIFPHQNKSVLVVQQKAPTDSPPLAQKPMDPKPIERPSMTVNGHATTGPVTPPQPLHPMDQVDSPLRNPRAPPEPPAIKFIPPTPAALTPGHEENRQLGFDEDQRPWSAEDQPKRTMSLMRRAFNNRRNSDSMNQRPGFLARTFSLSGNRKDLIDESTQTSKGSANALYPSVADKPADGSKLHPFWRPTHFWDDLEGNPDHDDDYGYPPIDNRPLPKRTFSEKLKRTFAILPIEDDYYGREPYYTDRRTMRRTPSGNMRVVKQRSNTSLRRRPTDQRLETNRRPVSGPPSTDQPFGYGFKEGNGGRIHTIPGLGLRVEYIGWSGMRKRMNDKKREQSRQKLRATISGPKSMRSGVDDVLRRRHPSL